MSQLIAGHEGLRTKVYTDTRGTKTVGVGFNMQQKNAKKIFEKYISPKEVAFNEI